MISKAVDKAKIELRSKLEDQFREREGILFVRNDQEKSEFHQRIKELEL
jgi:hypothetical protein